LGQVAGLEELQAVFVSLGVALSNEEDWVGRVNAMRKLQSLGTSKSFFFGVMVLTQYRPTVLGGAASIDGFSEALLALSPLLLKQVCVRWSYRPPESHPSTHR
jgi:hypothetical protein